MPLFFGKRSIVFLGNNVDFLGNIRCFLGTGSYALGNT